MSLDSQMKSVMQVKIILCTFVYNPQIFKNQTNLFCRLLACGFQKFQFNSLQKCFISSVLKLKLLWWTMKDQYLTKNNMVMLSIHMKLFWFFILLPFFVFSFSCLFHHKLFTIFLHLNIILFFTFSINVFFFLKMGYPNLRVVFTRALKTGVWDLHTCTRAPPVCSFCGGRTWWTFEPILGSITAL